MRAIGRGLIVWTVFCAVLSCGPRTEPAGESRPSPPVPVPVSPPPPSQPTTVVPAEPKPAAPAELAAALADPERVFAGILRTDKRIVPFAVFSKGQWLTPTEEAMLAGDLGEPVPQDSRAWFLSDRPWPGEWLLASPPGGRAVKPSDTLAAVSNHCQHNWAIAVNSEGRALGRNEHHQNAALAISRSADMQATPPIANDRPDAKRLMQFLLPALDAGEVAKRRPGEAVPTPEERARTVVRVTTLHRLRSSTMPLWYVEMERAYPKKPGEHCESISWLQAWVAENGAGPLVTLTSQFSRTDCSRKGDVSIRPLATVVLEGRRFLITVEHGYEDETYRIYEMTDTSVRLVASVSGGGC